MVSHSFIGRYPDVRLRRTRRFDWSRRMVRETTLTPDHLIWGLIIKEGNNVTEPVPNMPGVFRLSPDNAVKAAQHAIALGIPALALFPYTSPNRRTTEGKEALNPDNLLCQTARAIKAVIPDIGLIGDVALDPYTTHGHDGVIRAGDVANDETIAILAQQSVLLAQAGFDVVAPSDMMDGRVGVIRQALDANGYMQTQIMSYAAKYASVFYGPYRGAIGSQGILQGDKKTYQMDPANSMEGLREVALDLAEGADWVMVKPGMPYLDMIARVKDSFGVPVSAFQVSGEYAMLAAAGQAGALDFDAAMMEALIGFKRAGADCIISYYADKAAMNLTSA